MRLKVKPAINNAYRVLLKPTAAKYLYRLADGQFNLLTGWIDKNLKNCQNPYIVGDVKKLKGNKKSDPELYRYRVGKYRLIAEIKDNELIILLITIATRQSIYKK